MLPNITSHSTFASARKAVLTQSTVEIRYNYNVICGSPLVLIWPTSDKGSWRGEFCSGTSARTATWAPTCWWAGPRCGCPAGTRGFCCASGWCWGADAALCGMGAGGCRAASVGVASLRAEWWVGWKCARGAERRGLGTSGTDLWEGFRRGHTMPVARAWALLTPSLSGDEGRYCRGWMGWTGWWMGGREAKDCAGGVESPGWLAGLRWVESHCPSSWAQTATDSRLPSAHLLNSRQHTKTPPLESPRWIQCDALDHGSSHGENTYLIQWHSSDRRGQHWAWHILLNWTLVFALYPSPEHLSSAVRHPRTTSLPLPAEEQYQEKQRARSQ